MERISPNNAGDLYFERQLWYRSPRVKGVILPRTNPLRSLRIRYMPIAPDALKQRPYGLFSEASWDGCDSIVNTRCGDSYARAYAKLRSIAWNDAQATLAVDLAERKETIRMISESLSRLYRAARAVKRGRLGDAAKFLRLSETPKGASVANSFAGNWLAFRYGWVPLYYSIGNLIQVLHEPPRKKFVRASARALLDFQAETGTSTSTYHIIRGVHGFQRCTLKGVVEVDNNHIASLNQLGFVNPLSVAWELVPFSFVIDWVVDIGGYLENISAFWGLKFSDYSETRAVYYTLQVTRREGSNKPYLDYANYVVKYKRRVVGLTRPALPPLQVGTGLNAKHAIDLISLWRVLFRR